MKRRQSRTSKSRAHRVLTPEQKAFFDSFKPLRPKPRESTAPQESIAPKPGDRVLIVGNHPHKGKVGEVLGYENLKVLNETGMRVRADDGSEFFVMGRHQFQPIPPLADVRKRRRTSKRR